MSLLWSHLPYDGSPMFASAHESMPCADGLVNDHDAHAYLDNGCVTHCDA